MPIRKTDLLLTKDAVDFHNEVKDALKPIFRKYENKYSFEEMHYMVSNASHNIIFARINALREK